MKADWDSKGWECTIGEGNGQCTDIATYEDIVKRGKRKERTGYTYLRSVSKDGLIGMMTFMHSASMMEECEKFREARAAKNMSVECIERETTNHK